MEFLCVLALFPVNNFFSSLRSLIAEYETSERELLMTIIIWYCGRSLAREVKRSSVS